MTSKLSKILMLLVFLLASFALYGGTVTLSTDRSTVMAGEVFRFILTAEGSFDSINEPVFKDFTVENRSESQSSSISIINGRMESKKTVNYIYHLRAEKAGVFKIGPASVKLQSGKTADSNIVSVTVTGSLTSPPSSHGDDSVDSSVPTTNSLLAPLTNWEKKTPDYFLRAVVKPSGEVYEGEPLVVKYYLFAKPGIISDISSYKSPSFENCWKDEKVESRFKVERGAIEGAVYDYGLLATYTLIPQKGADSVTATQMILDVTTGSFFNTRRHTLSTPALRIPLNPLPEKENRPDGLFGSVTVSADRQSIKLDRDNLLETVTYTISGCGNLNSAEITLEEDPALLMFSPEIDLTAGDTQNGYCGHKKYKFMIKGLRKGKTALNGRALSFFSREKGWEKVEVPQIQVDIKEVSALADSSTERNARSFELLKELPAGIKKYEISPLVERTWFKIAMGIPFLVTVLSFMIWILKSVMKKRAGSYQTKLTKWKTEISSSATMNELLNNFYDALKELFGIELRGERKQNLKRKYGESIEDVLGFIKEIEHSSYGAKDDADLSDFKLKALAFLNFRGHKK